MSDVSEDKIKSLLSDPASLQMIAGIAQSLGGFGQTKSDAGTNTQEPLPDTPIPEKVPLALTSDAEDKRIALLHAIKPYINPTKQERLDSMVKALRVADLLTKYKSNLL